MVQPPGPGDLGALLEAGLGHHRAGRSNEAERCYRQVLAANPRHPDALHFLGMLAHQVGRNDMAIAILSEAVAASPDNPNVYNVLAASLAALDRFAEAAMVLGDAEKVAPGFAPTHIGLGRILVAQGKPADAEAAFRRAVALAEAPAGGDPASAGEAWAALGGLLARQGRSDEAAAALERALAIQPTHPDVLLNLGTLRFEQGRVDDAVDCFRRATMAAPGMALAYYNLGRALQQLDRLDEAEAAYRQAVERAPDNAEALTNLGNLAKDRDDFEAAAGHYRRAVAARPGSALAYYHLGNVLGLMGESDAALDALGRALGLDPDFAPARNIRGQYLMMKGNFEAGLSDHEARRKDPTHNVPPYVMDRPEWDGQPTAEPVLIWPEQGVGDHILYAGLLAQARARAPSIIYQCDPRLVPMLSRGVPDVTVLPAGGSAPNREFSRHLPMASLMRCLKPWPQDFEPMTKYIVPRTELEVAARTWLAGLGPAPKIGLSWRSAVRRIGHRKTLPIEAWAPILKNRAATFVNLQYGETDAEIAAAAETSGAAIETMPGLDRFDDLEGLAALIDCLDLVITTSNVTAHLAGALGKPAWLILQKTPLWYWAPGLRPTGTLFYPALRPYRQGRTACWDDAIAAVAADLDRWLAGGGRL